MVKELKRSCPETRWSLEEVQALELRAPNQEFKLIVVGIKHLNILSVLNSMQFQLMKKQLKR